MGFNGEKGGSGADSSHVYGGPEAPCLSPVRVKGTDDSENRGVGRRNGAPSHRRVCAEETAEGVDLKRPPHPTPQAAAVSASPTGLHCTMLMFVRASHWKPELTRCHMPTLLSNAEQFFKYYLGNDKIK